MTDETLDADGEKKKGDGSKRFTLKGGKNSGMTLRIYPRYSRWEGNKQVPEMWEDVVFDGELYVHPATHEQNPKHRYLLFQAQT